MQKLFYQLHLMEAYKRSIQQQSRIKVPDNSFIANINFDDKFIAIIKYINIKVKYNYSRLNGSGVKFNLK